MNNRDVTKNIRRYNSYFGSINVNYNFLVHPLIPALWSLMFPGFGHLLIGAYLDGYALIIWEVFINTQSHLNVAIIHTFHGDFEQAKQVLSIKWAMLYVPVYLYCFWDSYRTTVETNLLYTLAEKENARIVPYKLSGFSINYLDKTKPTTAAAWSFFVPGLGHLLLHRIPTGFLLLVWWVLICYFSNATNAIHYTFLGCFAHAQQVLKPEWLLFMPSIYGFAIYDTYTSSVEFNKVFKLEQAQFFREQYQHPSFPMPLTKRENR